jgi:hypothetical protein
VEGGKMKVYWSEDVRDKHNGKLKYYGARVHLASDFEKAKKDFFKILEGQIDSEWYKHKFVECFGVEK